MEDKGIIIIYYRANTVPGVAQPKNSISVGAAHKSGDIIVYGTNSRYFITDFSSEGPTRDGRIKPDICVAGYKITSAKSEPNNDNIHCDTSEKSGTSMAAPLIASAIAAIEQYFQEGYYYEGKKDLSKSKIPSASLVKALLIHSAENVAGRIVDGKQIFFDKWPNNKQGFGVVSLDRVLQFSNNIHYKLKIIEGEIEPSTYADSYDYYVKISFF